MDKFKLTRFAPTPSGFLHLGNIYSFLITKVLAEKYGAKILLRIDDLDHKRTKKKYIQDIFDSLDFMELDYDLGPSDLKDFKKNFSCFKRSSLYDKHIKRLVEKKSVFVCDCSRNKIEKMNPKGFYTGFCKKRKLPFETPESALRIDTPVNQKIKIQTLGGLQESEIPRILRDFVIKKKDGNPAYQLQSIIDDIHFGVDLIVRGNDLWGSSLAQTYLASQLDKNEFSQITFHHHDLILGKKKQKLSKSMGDTSLQFLRKSGMKKEGVFELIGQMTGHSKKIKNLEDFSKSYLKTIEKPKIK
ncbi:glutamyl- or glutaminyl-tRNA synthetase [Belliella baltica DSM 15883]|uniref:Glutamyl-or glutaminyl-tRNA synthetase n=1 Tax=Belliella baltica (strain DSM 15883 / CIP 108006 / LMG 21964 / BA134) TaxID=866536 RepID=I3Z8P1_BELBD|nr:tRNA glutamyl-Q synthetase [Belliella baltica]AFL85609.1 glutamyl- or glutaminyl-tRNA synthetase [Belliella baltica DSM 15883]